MPLYEYECTQCGRRREVIQKFSDPPPKRCEACKGKLKKLPSAPAIQFKGSGWYVTDYGRGSGSKNSSSPPESKEGKEAGSGKPKSEAPAKPAKKKSD